ncbi:hypothetical protein GQX73_g6619 [Xylaria multiplex]|uniref:BTB domain-containing protein n=1 Tax=Xylaria multiplex TaxID=323545 RepID=A0A7C8ISH3_9PEZI|nr:hypothetical protein GQX73_g6619 [Xylaria multiplex]
MAETSIVIDPYGKLRLILCNPRGQDHEDPNSGTGAEPLGEPLNEPGFLGSQINSFKTVSAMLDSDEGTELEHPHADYPKGWHYKVSLQRIAMLSANFEDMLDEACLEVIPPVGEELWCWVVEEFTPEAMLIVLNIMHGRNNEVPRELDLDSLAEVARVVDYFGCYEVMEVPAKSWIPHLEDEIPESYGDKLLTWIRIAGAFHEDKIFKRCTRQAILGYRNDYDTPPIPQVINDIARSRISKLDKIFEHLYEFVDSLIDSTLCSYEGEAHNLGIFIKHMHMNSLMPRPKSPYQGLNITGVVARIATIPHAGFLVLGQEPIHKGPSGYSDSLESVLTPMPVRNDIKGEPFEFYHALNGLIVQVKRVAEEVEGLDL